MRTVMTGALTVNLSAVLCAVSSVGTQANAESKRLFLRGYEEMMKRLSPEWVIFYGESAGRMRLEC